MEKIKHAIELEWRHLTDSDIDELINLLRQIKEL